MTTSQVLLPAFLRRNPVAWREIIGLARGRSKWFWRWMWALTAVLLITPILPAATTFHQALTTWTGIIGMVYTILYGLVVIRTITVASDTIIRERRGQTWELLLLTGVGTWRLILGKWLGTLRFMLRDYAWLFVVRLGLYIWVSGSASVSWAYYSWEQRETITAANLNFNLELIALMAGVAVIFLALEAMLAAALGIALALLPWGQRAGVWLAIVVRVGIALAFGFAVLWSTGVMRPYPYHVSYPEATNTFIMVIAGTLFENGALFAADWLMETGYRSLHMIAVAQTIMVGLYLALIALTLRVAVRVAAWQGVNQAGSVLKTKPKRAYALATSASAESRVPADPRRMAPALAIPAPGTANCFGLAQPQAYRVEVFHYGRHLGRLILRAASPQETVYLHFANVTYLELPMTWQGAGFQTASAAEFTAFMQTARLNPNSLTSVTLRLYQLQADQPIRIVAGSATLTYDLQATLATA